MIYSTLTRNILDCPWPKFWCHL